MLPEIKGNTVFVAALDWGLGHATRCIQVINHLLSKNKKVILGGSGNSGMLMQQYFSDLTYIELPGYAPVYGEGKNMYWPMLKQSRHFLRVIRKENALLKTIVHRYKIDTVISDNRYGLYHSEVESIFITHQLFIRAGWLSTWVKKINHRYIRKYQTCWIPDFEDKQISLSGDLSHGHHTLPNVVYIGPLSQFAKPIQATQKKYKALAIISGPEPQRSLFEKKLLEEFKNSEGQFVLVRGLPENSHQPLQQDNTLVYAYANTAEIENLMACTEKIICRSGYSSIMDLWVTSRLKDAHLVPTPGQTEQEYLAQWNQLRNT